MGKVFGISVGSFLIGIAAGYLIRHFLQGRAKAGG